MNCELNGRIEISKLRHVGALEHDLFENGNENDHDKKHDDSTAIGANRCVDVSSAMVYRNLSTSAV